MKRLILIIGFLLAVSLCTAQQINKAEYFIDGDPGYGLGTPIAINSPAEKVELSFDISTNTLSEGFHRMVFRARDDLGRWSFTPIHYFYIFKTHSLTISQINKAEYFIDVDPGLGLATPITVNSPGDKLTLLVDVNVNSLSDGFHKMGLRVRDQSGKWSHCHLHIFYVFKKLAFADSNIDKVEYFIDSDPGFGKANPIAVSSPADKLSLPLVVDLSSLSKGFHMILFRAHDNLGRWGQTCQQIFYVFENKSIKETKVKKIEYFVDTDPGIGMAEPIAVNAPDYKLAIDFDIPIHSLTADFHLMCFRAMDEQGKWSLLSQRSFYVIKSLNTPTAFVTGLEYYFDADPGFGKGTAISMTTPGTKGVIDFTASLSGLSVGNHIMYFRCKDALNRWSHAYAHAFSLSITSLGDRIVKSWFKLYPNPNSGSFRVELPEIQCYPLKLFISNLKGQNVYSRELNGLSNDLSLDLPNGIYFINIESGDQFFTQKMQINR